MFPFYLLLWPINYTCCVILIVALGFIIYIDLLQPTFI